MLAVNITSLDALQEIQGHSASRGHLGHSSIDTMRIYTMRSGKEERRQLFQLRLIL